MRAQGTSGAPSDREVWRRSQDAEATPDETSYLLDLAAFADNRLDDDETARRRDGVGAAIGARTASQVSFGWRSVSTSESSCIDGCSAAAPHSR